MSIVADFHFLRPLALLLLLALPLFWFLRRRMGSSAGAWTAAVDAHLLPHLLERVPGRDRRGGPLLAMAAWMLACFALAGPAWEREPMPLYHNQAARVLALELGDTMHAQDEKPSRLMRARFKLGDILARSHDYQTALIGYAGDAFVAAPLTDDSATVRNLVDALDPSTMPVAGNDTARAIEVGVDLIEQAGLHGGEIVLLADGVGGNAKAAAARALAKGIRVSVLGIGTPGGAPVAMPQGDFLKDDSGNLRLARLDEAALRELAEAGGGRYARATADGRDLDLLLPDRVDAGAEASAGGSQADSTRWRDRGPWLLLALLPLAALGFRRGWLMGLVLLVSLPAPSVQAAGLSDLWLRADQQTARALARDDAKHALEVAPTPEWRGGAAWRAGDYEAALHEYEQVGGADGAYNKGNALARLGRYDEAIQAYDDALALAPDMDDAKANRSAVESFLQQQKSSPDDGGKSNEKGKKDRKNDKDTSSSDSSQDGEESQQDPSSGEGKEETSAQDGDKEQQPSSANEDKPSQQGNDNSPQGAAEKPDQAQQQALSDEIDQHLADAAAEHGNESEAKAQAGTPDDDAAREQQQAFDHWLQRVPDDPGGLLRNKFRLEYQRRQQSGGESQ